MDLLTHLGCCFLPHPTPKSCKLSGPFHSVHKLAAAQRHRDTAG